jgi:hypothetical protein
MPPDTFQKFGQFKKHSQCVHTSCWRSRNITHQRTTRLNDWERYLLTMKENDYKGGNGACQWKLTFLNEKIDMSVRGMLVVGYDGPGSVE